MSLIIASGTLYLRDSSGVVQYSTDNTNWTPVDWPATIENSNTADTLTVLFRTNITLTSVTNYFICNSDNIQFGSRSLKSNGTRPIIVMDGVTDYSGLIQNGTLNIGVSVFSAIYVCNLEIQSINGSTIQKGAGWFGQTYYGNTKIKNVFVNCTSDGFISSESGGIVGSFAGSNEGVLSILGCSSTGVIFEGAGGIIGRDAATSLGTVDISECYSSGEIKLQAGGIVGPNSVADSGTITVTKCYSTGVIVEGGAGGIFGSRAGYIGGSGAANAIECYSNGAIGTNCGGIFGQDAGNNSTKVVAVNCYSTGTIDGDNFAGGIFSVSTTGGDILATNCYTCGLNTSSTLPIPPGGIYGNDPNDNVFGVDNFSESANGNSGIWSDTNANGTLLDTPTTTYVGTTWVKGTPAIVNTAYELRKMGHTPYSLQNILPSYELETTYSQTINAGTSTISAILPPGYTYSILDINNSTPDTYPTITMNTTTGKISTTPTTVPGPYTLIVRNQINPYSITQFDLTVLEFIGLASIPTSIPECCQPNVCTMNPQETNYNTSVITQKKGGKAVDKSVTDFYVGVATGQRTAHSQPIFKSYYDYMNYLQGKYK
jgi:hypothetical protein